GAGGGQKRADQRGDRPHVVGRRGEPDVVAHHGRYQDHDDDARFRQGDQVRRDPTPLARQRDDDGFGRDAGGFGGRRRHDGLTTATGPPGAAPARSPLPS